MGILIGNFTRILRDPTTETGLSARDGTEIEAVDDLPDHLVEVHLFADGTYASTFVEGVALVGLRNAMAMTHQVGDRNVNAVVLIARFDEPRPEGATPLECMRVVHHERRFEADRAAATKFMADLQESRRIEADRGRAHAEAEAAPIVARLKAVGFDASFKMFSGETLVHAARPDPREHSSGPRFTIDVLHGGEIEEIKGVDDRLHRGDVDLRADLAAIADRYGLDLDPEGCGNRDFVVRNPPSDVEGCLKGVLALEDCLDECLRLMRDAYEARFRNGMKVTAARRRLFEAGMDGGIHIWTQRGFRRARAGNESIGASEIDALVRMGWIAPGPSGYVVTDEALLAAGIERASDDVPGGPGVR